MKKYCLIITILFLFSNLISSSAELCTSTTISEEWTGLIRIEGKNDTVWNGIVTVNESIIYAKNKDTGEFEEYIISFPSVLGAFDEASKLGGFSYVVEYWPNWDAFLLKTVENDTDWWHYWVDYNLSWVDVGNYELTNEDDEILIGYLENFEAHALKISVDKTVIKLNEEFTVSVFNETDSSVKNVTVYVGLNTYTTDDHGNVTIKLSNKGNHVIYSEKDDFVRSDKKNIEVKIKNRTNNLDLQFFTYIFRNHPLIKFISNSLNDIFKIFGFKTLYMLSI